MTNNKNDIQVAFHADTGERLLLNKKERKLVKLILGKAMGSKAAKQLIAQKLGTEYIEIGEILLREMGGG